MQGTRHSTADRDCLDGRALARRDALPASLAAPPAELASALSRSDAGSRQDVLARLQAAGGNLEVGRLIASAGSSSTVTETVRYPFTATIRKAPAAQQRPTDPAAVPSRSDKPPEAGKGGHEQEALIEKAPVPQTAAAGPAGGGGAATPAGPHSERIKTLGESADGGGAPAPAEQAAGGGTEAPGTARPPMKLPDVELPALAEVERCDAVVSALGYTGSITKGGATPSGFGVTRSFSSTLKDINVAFAPNAYVITATVEHPITYQIRSGTGPDGQVDVGSDTAPAITAGNYANVAADLTPNMSDLNGRPPRTSFWAEDLTTKHELVHANDDKGNGPLATVQAMTWLNTQTASGPFDLIDLVKQVPKRFAANLLAALSTEDGEKHAYGDGAPSYKARADSISAKGAKGDYT